MINLTPERTREILAERKAEKAKRDAIDQQFTLQKAEREAYYQNKKANPEKVTVKVPHICEKCLETIPPKTEATIRSVITGSGWPFSMTTKYTHFPECPKIEVKQA